jgi:hypothetical protein
MGFREFAELHSLVALPFLGCFASPSLQSGSRLPDQTATAGKYAPVEVFLAAPKI